MTSAIVVNGSRQSKDVLKYRKECQTVAKVYVFNGGHHGHVNPTLGLVGELVRRGGEVIYYATTEFQQIIEGTGAIFRAYPVAEPDERITGLEHLAEYYMRYSGMVLPYLIETAQAEHPDYIIFDMFRVWGWHLGQYLNIPAIRSSPSFITNMLVLQQIMPETVQTLISQQASESAMIYSKQYAEMAAHSEHNTMWLALVSLTAFRLWEI